MKYLKFSKPKGSLLTVHSILFLSFLVIVVSCTKKSDTPVEIVGVQEYAVLDESVSARIPHIFLSIDGENEVHEKDKYLDAELTIKGEGRFPDQMATSTRIKGRGNSTWTKPKKPYRLKLNEKKSLLGLPAAKDWVLLANYNDYTLMANAVAMKVGKLLGMPYTHDIISVDLTINGIYRGNYNLTQQVEIKENRVDLGEGGTLWELDSYFDEKWKFKSSYLGLPVMLKDPEVESQKEFERISIDFQNFENLLFAKDFPRNNYSSIFDNQQFVNFLIVNMLVGNHEVCHPKSVYMHKKEKGKFTMGPLWDFDFAFGFSEDDRRYFHNQDLDLLRENDTRAGAELYKRILKDPKVKLLLKNTWLQFRNSRFDELLQYVEFFAAQNRESQKRDYDLWKVGNNNHAKNKADLKTFLRKRTAVIDSFISKL